MRPGDLVRLGYGLGVILAPDRIAHVLTGSGLDDRARVVARARGGVQVAQGLALLGCDGDGVRGLSLGVDTLHVLSMLVLAVADPSRRRLALTDAAVTIVVGQRRW